MIIIFIYDIYIYIHVYVCVCDHIWSTCGLELLLVGGSMDPSKPTSTTRGMLPGRWFEQSRETVGLLWVVLIWWCLMIVVDGFSVFMVVDGLSRLLMVVDGVLMVDVLPEFPVVQIRKSDFSSGASRHPSLYRPSFRRVHLEGPAGEWLMGWRYDLMSWFGVAHGMTLATLKFYIRPGSPSWQETLDKETRLYQEAWDVGRRGKLRSDVRIGYDYLISRLGIPQICHRWFKDHWKEQNLVASRRVHDFDPPCFAAPRQGIPIQAHSLL